MTTRMDGRERSGARRRPASTWRPGWCRATWSLLVAAVCWAAFAFARLWPGDLPWLGSLHARMPAPAYVIVPGALLLALPVVRRIRAPVPAVPRRLIAALALVALVPGVPEVATSIGS